MLFVVATPIGNLLDISPRALQVLKEADVVLCEDTRVTRKLLSHYDIRSKLESYHANSHDSKIESILKMLEGGKDLALVTDAGTPGISDPGSHLLDVVRNRLGDKVKIVAIPGPSALVSALSISGLPASGFLFLGFLPRKKGRKALFTEIAESERTVAFYESPHRIMATLLELQNYLDEKRKIVIAREITKVYEEVLSGTIPDVIHVMESDKNKQKGEFVVMVAGK